MAQTYVDITGFDATAVVAAKLVELFGEDEVHIECTVTADFVRDDYGVPGSPVWFSPENMLVDTISINGVDYAPKVAAAKFGDDVIEAIWETACNAAEKKDDHEWE